MPVIDYFGGYNRGMENLSKAFISSREQDRRDLEEKRRYENQKRLDALADIQIKTGQEKLKETQELAGRRKTGLEELQRIASLENKPQEAISPSTPSPASGSMVADLQGTTVPASLGPVTPPTPVKYTRQEKNKLMLDSAIKNGLWDEVGKLGQVVDVTNKINEQDGKQLNDWATAVGNFRKNIKNPQAVQQFAEALAAKYGVDPKMVQGIDWTPQGDIHKPDGQGGEIVGILDPQKEEYHWVHVTPKTDTSLSIDEKAAKDELKREGKNPEDPILLRDKIAENKIKNKDASQFSDQELLAVETGAIKHPRVTVAQAKQMREMKEAEKVRVANASRAIFANRPTNTPGVWTKSLPGGGLEYHETDENGNDRTLNAAEVKQRNLAFREEVPTERTKTMQQLAPRVQQLAQSVRKDIDSQITQLGPAVSRWNDFWTNKVGAPNPRFKKLTTDVDLLSTLLMNMHVGARGGEQMIDRFERMLSAGKQSPENMKAAVDTIISYAEDTSKSIINPATRPGGAVAPPPTTPKPTHKYIPGQGLVAQ